MKDTVASMYLDGTYAKQNAEFGDDNALWKAKNICSMLDQHQQKLNRICELGCGGGGILLEIAKMRPDINELHGYEPMPEAFAVCATRENDKIKFFPHTLGPDTRVERYDALIMSDVFEHIEDYLGFLRGVSHIADAYYFHIPLDMSVQMVARAKPLEILRQQVGHLHYFSKDTALASLEHAGYQILDWVYTDGSSSNYKTLRYQIMKFPRKVMFALAPNLAVRFLGGYSLLVVAKKKK